MKQFILYNPLAGNGAAKEAAEAKAKGYSNGEVKQKGVKGYTVYSYRCKYDKETDKLISREFEDSSHYVKLDKIVISTGRTVDSV